jgi:hypothetical protein
MEIRERRRTSEDGPRKQRKEKRREKEKSFNIFEEDSTK